MEDRAISLNDQELMENAEQLRAITNAELLKENEELKRELAHLLLRKSSVTPQRPKGHWISTLATALTTNGIALNGVACSECGKVTYITNRTPICCPWCDTDLVVLTGYQKDLLDKIRAEREQTVEREMKEDK